MVERAVVRLRDMKEAIAEIDALLEGRTAGVLQSDKVIRAAYERFLEILSEASRGVPDEWKNDAVPALPWKRIADIGNQIRHAYERLDTEILWNIYEYHLPLLKQAIDDMLSKHATS